MMCDYLFPLNQGSANNSPYTKELFEKKKNEEKYVTECRVPAKSKIFALWPFIFLKICKPFI